MSKLNFGIQDMTSDKYSYAQVLYLSDIFPPSAIAGQLRCTMVEVYALLI